MQLNWAIYVEITDITIIDQTSTNNVVLLDKCMSLEEIKDT